VRLVGSGHPAIRATHHKTLELTPDVDISERATCVVAVGAAGALQPLAGDVRITITAGTESFTFEARGNPAWDPAGTAIIRRSPFRLPDTLATHATAAASDLPRALVAAMRDGRTAIELSAEPIRGRRCAVLFGFEPALHDRRLAAELAVADVVVAEDAAAARALGTRTAHGPVDVDGRVLVVATTDLPGATVVDALREVDVETVGLPPALAAAAASPSRAPVFLAPDGADVRAVLRDAPAATRLVMPVAAADVADALAAAEAQRGSDGGVLVQPFAPPVRVHPSTPIELPSRDGGYLCLDAITASDALDPRVRAAIDGLLADGVPSKAAANALAALTGWPRRRAYDYVVSVADRPSAHR
jgi:hypothetical protein